MENNQRMHSIVAVGGGYTAEAWDIDRKMLMHQQLQLARKLRATMEQACEDSAKVPRKKAREIFHHHIGDMNELVSLTEVVMGNSLDSHHEYKKRTRAVEIEMGGPKKILHDFLADLVSPHYIQKFEARPNKVPKKKNEVDLNKTVQKKRKYEKKGHQSTGQSNKNEDLKKPGFSNVFKPPTHVLLQHSSISTPSVPSTPPPTSKEQTRDRDTPKQFRKCHDCKVMTSDFRKCHFWLASGIKCRKSYCKECLVSKYKVDDFDLFPNKEGWHCPACLGTCQCIPCVKEQEKALMRMSRKKHRTKSIGET